MSRENHPFVFSYGGHDEPVRTVSAGAPFKVFTEDCFSGRLTSTDGKPREVAPYPYVNPLVGPIAIEGVRAGEILAVHLLALEPARDWGVATVSPNFGLLSGTRINPNLQPEQEEKVWIWRVSDDGTGLTTETASGRTLKAPIAPFHGSIGVAPAHGEVRPSVVPGDFGGNLDLPELGAGTTLYLKVNVDRGFLYIGDGHYVQGDGEIAGTAVEGAMKTIIVIDKVPADDSFDWPRIETAAFIGVVGCAKPLEDATRIAVDGLIRWVSQLCGLEIADAHQLVSQTCRLRIGNTVNPLFSVLCSIPKDVLETEAPIMDGLHQRLAVISLQTDSG